MGKTMSIQFKFDLEKALEVILYIAMKNGHVPSGIYTILTDVRDNSSVPLVATAKRNF